MGVSKGHLSGDITLVTEKFIAIHVTTERAEVERTCAAFETHGIPMMVEHVLMSGYIDPNARYPGYRILTARSSEQQARAIIGRAITARAEIGAIAA